MSDSAAAQTNLAAAALVTAFVALLTALAQVVQQYFATADGYRRCQPAVIGSWAQYTRRKYRYQQFRFETFFSTAEIRLEASPDPTSITVIDVHSSEKEVQDNLLPREDPSEGNDAMVSWIPLLKSLQWTSTATHNYIASDVQKKAFRRALTRQHTLDQEASWRRRFPFTNPFTFRTQKTIDAEKAGADLLVIKAEDKSSSTSFRQKAIFSAPSVRRRERSWDFMPPDVIRPFAITNIGDIAILARRLGMKWTAFRPADGVLRAEGCGHLFTSVQIRSLGILLQYQRTGISDTGISDSEGADLKFPLDNKYDYKEIYLPRPEADRMGFGILPGFRPLGMTDMTISDPEEVVATMRKLQCSIESQELIKEISQNNDGWTPGFSDMIGMATPMIRVRGSSVIQIPAPSNYYHGLTYEREGFKVFQYRLAHHIEDRKLAGLPITPRTQWVLDQYDYLNRTYPKLWEDQNEANRTINSRPLAFLEAIHDRWDETTAYFLEHQTKGTLVFRDLVIGHVERAVHWFYESRNELKKGGEKKDRETFDLIRWIALGMHEYFDALNQLTVYMQEKGCPDKDLVMEAWFMLLLRAFCWQRAHYMVGGPTVPSALYRSRMPIYIG